VKTWEDSYLCFLHGQFHPIVVRVHYVVPSCEMLSVDFLPPEGFDELHVAEYARQAVGQQAMADYLQFAEKTSNLLKRTSKLDDPFFEEHHDPSTGPR
jgi:hypothetical protein